MNEVRIFKKLSNDEIVAYDFSFQLMNVLESAHNW
jgi:hypothetical protein